MEAFAVDVFTRPRDAGNVRVLIDERHPFGGVQVLVDGGQRQDGRDPRLARDPWLALFGQGRRADVAPGSAWLATRAQAVSRPEVLTQATSDEVLGVGRAWTALETWAFTRKLTVIRELIRRHPLDERWEPDGLPGEWEPALHQEVAAALGTSVIAAGKLVHLAWTLDTRLRGIAQALEDGRLDPARVKMIADEAAVLEDESLFPAAEAIILAGLAGCRTWSALQRLAQRAVIMVDPAGAERRREKSEREHARLRFWRENCGTCALQATGLPTDEALAASANIEARARAYKAASVTRPMDILRVMAYLDLLNGVTIAQRAAWAQADDAARKADAEAAAAAAAAAAAKQAASGGGAPPTDPPAPAGHHPDASDPHGDTPDHGSPSSPDDGTPDNGTPDNSADDNPPSDDDPDGTGPDSPDPDDGTDDGTRADGDSPGGNPHDRDAGPGNPGHDNDPGPDGTGPGSTGPDSGPRPDDTGPHGDTGPGPDDTGPHGDTGPGPGPGPDDTIPDGTGPDYGGFQGGGAGCRGSGAHGGGTHGGPDDEPWPEAPDDDHADPAGLACQQCGGAGGGTGLPIRASLTIPAEALRWLAEWSSQPGDPTGSGGTGSGGGGPGGRSRGGPGPCPACGVLGGAGLPAREHLVLPLLTLAGLAQRPGEAHGLGALDPALARGLAAAGARHPDSQFCVTVTGSRGIALGHGCLRPARGGQAAAIVAGPGRVTIVPSGRPGPDGGFGSWTVTLPGAPRPFTVAIHPIPVGDCDHRLESSGYRPGARLRHLVQVRDGECSFPACSRAARESDFEHAVPYASGGRTCACNAHACSRSCHHAKQTPGWQVTKPGPGWTQWTTKAGRTYLTGPWSYPD